MEADIGERDTEPGHQTGDSCTGKFVLIPNESQMSHKKTTRTSHVGEPAKDLAGTTVDTHVRQGGEQSTEDDRDIGETLP